MDRPKFSVLIPTHNRADVLPFAIRSALWQTEADFELLVAGDGCSDDTSAVVGTFADSRIRWFNLPKARGIGYANRNVALREARGRFVAYLAHDDIWFPDHLARLGELLDTTDAELVHSRHLAVDAGGEIRPSAFNMEIASHRAGLARGRLGMSITDVAHPRACLERYGYWNEELLRGADVELWYRIARGRPRNVAFLPEPTALHFIASWRSTTAHGHRRRVARRLLDGLLADPVPAVLNLDLESGLAPQAVAWRWLSEDSPARIREIRRAAVQLQDAQSWAETAAGLLALRAGTRMGGWLDRLWRGALWLSSRRWRQWNAALRQQIHAIEDRGIITPAEVGGQPVLTGKAEGWRE